MVETCDRKIVIDPGLALGYQRHGLLPHPAQVAVGEQVRQLIVSALEAATDVVMSHFHGDHVPLPDANPYQLQAQAVAALIRRCNLWAKGDQGLSANMTRRRAALAETLGREIPGAEGQHDGVLLFSRAVPHGTLNTHLGTVMMTCIKVEDAIFVHASDIQLLNRRAISQILHWGPDIVLVGGPPLYLSALSQGERTLAWTNARRLADQVELVILDHHLLRSETGLSWLNRLSREANGKVICAADYMGRPRCLLEARRVQLYAEMPVPDGWHEAYARGKAGTERYQHYRQLCAPHA
jgi:predicted metallo-beta-lactamase superfamily hydrolase